MEWFDEKLTELSEASDVKQKKNILAEFRIKLANLPHEESRQIAGNLDFNRLLPQLTSNDNDYIKDLCDTVKLIFTFVEPGSVHSVYAEEMWQLLTHPQTPVRIMILEEIQRQATNPERKLKSKLPALLNDTPLLVAACERIADEELSVAMAAVETIKQIGRQPGAAAVLFSGLLLRTFARLLSKNDEVAFRVYEIVVTVAKTPEGLQAAITSGFLSSLISMLDNDDVLLQLNALELLTGLAMSSEGFHYLEQQGVLQKLAERIALAEEAPLSNLFVPGLMKFFGNLACAHPRKIFSKYQVVVTGLFDVLHSDDLVMLGPALDTLGHVAGSVEGKYALQDYNESMPYVLTKIGQIIQNAPTELRVRALNTLASLLDVPKDLHDNRILSLTKEWFDGICDKPLDLIVSLCKQPFVEIRKAALEVLAVISGQVWGQELICPLTSVINFLFDRHAETFKECKEVKYKVVQNLSEAPPGIFPANIMLRFKQFVSEGPFYVEAQADVATEGAT